LPPSIARSRCIRPASVCAPWAAYLRPFPRFRKRSSNPCFTWIGRAQPSPRIELRLPAAALQIERATLRPGSRIHVRIAARGGALAVAADVVRCSVWILQADAVIYRGALRFEEACTAFWEEQVAGVSSS
jgi:hypothetical protein